MNFRRLIITVCIVTALVLLVYFLWWHLDLGIHRYLDADELAHLHWASHVAMGKQPFVDFFSFFPPGFWWMFTPIFWIWHGTSVVIAARVVAFVIFALLCGAVGLVFWILRGSWIYLVAAMILAFLPLPFDKFIEVRPDTVATLVVVVGMIFQIFSLRGDSTMVVKRFLRISGLLYAISLFILPKVIPQVLFAFFICVLSQKKKFLYILQGFILVFIEFGIWVVSLGDFGRVWYSLTKLPLEANQISKFFIMQPDLFFYPNGIYYGSGGYNQGLIVNHILWVVGLGVGLYRLFTPLKHPKKSGFWEELLLAGSFFVLVLSYVELVPLKHAQYLIPIAVFISFYVADGIFLLWEKFSRSSTGLFLFLLFFLSAGFVLYQTMGLVNGPKRAWTNTGTLAGMDTLFAKIPFNTPILDLEGRTLYYPDPYYACCLPFGQFSQFLSRPLPSVAAMLEEHHVRFIFDSELNRIDTLLPQDRAYIRAHYQLSDIPGLFVRTN